MDTTAPTLSLLDLPTEILENIILQVNDPNDIHLHPFLNITRKGSTVCIKLSKSQQTGYGKNYINRLYNAYLIQNPLCNVLPSTLFILSRVSKGFRDEINNNNIYWRSLYIRDCRQGKPYKYDNWNYKLKYIQNIYLYYYQTLRNTRTDLEFTTKKFCAKINNSETYLKVMTDAVLNKTIDFPNQVYSISDLEQVNERFGYVTVNKTIRNIRFEEILYSRRKCLNEIAVYDKEIRYTAPKIKKLDEILYGFKIQGCIQTYNPHEDSNRRNLAICMDRFWARVLRP